MNKIFPNKLKTGDEIRIVAPSRSMAIISPETRKIADKRFLDLGLKLSFGKNIEESDEFRSSSIKSRVDDLHEAFTNKKVKAILTVIGGFNCNQMLEDINWELIRKNPKIFCGYSDITALNNAIFAKTGLISYSGPHYSSFGQKLYFDYTLDYFKKCLFDKEPFEIKPSPSWSDDAWYKNQDKRKLITNEGWLIINEGKAEGTILGANLCTFNLLQGTEYFPDLSNSVIFIEDDETSNSFLVDRNLQSLIHQPGFSGVKGIIIGRFQKASEITNEKIIKIIKTKKKLEDIPVIANIDFGHTNPMITFPIGGKVKLVVKENQSSIKIEEH